MLAQNINGKLRPIRYVSKAFTETESRWKIQHQELYAIKFAFESFRPYVIDKRIKIVTDNANLQFLKSVKSQQAKIARWCLAMSKFDFYIEHRPGRNNSIPDYLGRHPISAIADTLCYHKVNSFLALAFSLDIPNAHSSHTKEMSKTPLNISRLKLFECQQQDPFFLISLTTWSLIVPFNF